MPVRKQAHYSVEIPFALGCRLYGYMEKLNSCIRDSEAITIILHQVSQDHQQTSLHSGYDDLIIPVKMH